MTLPLRTACLMPGCRRTCRAYKPGDEWLCSRHCTLASAAARTEYTAAWREAAKADRRKANGYEVGLAPYIRVNDAWDRVKAEAFAAAKVTA